MPSTRKKSLKKPAAATFLNYDAEHRSITGQDLKIINAHVNFHVVSRARRQKDDEAEASPQSTRLRSEAVHRNVTSDIVEQSRRRKDDEANPLLRRSPLDDQIGGLRTDPFDMLPIQHGRDVREAFDYYTQIYVPLSYRISNLQPIQARTMMLNVLHDSMFCETFVAMMLMMQSLKLDPSERLSPAILYHSNNAISQLHQKLSSPEERHSDAVIMTITSQAVVHLLACQYDIFDAHVAAVRHIVSLRGGLDSLGWHGFVKAAVISIFESWDLVHKRTQQSISSAEEYVASKSGAASELTKPSMLHYARQEEGRPW